MCPVAAAKAPKAAAKARAVSLSMPWRAQELAQADAVERHRARDKALHSRERAP